MIREDIEWDIVREDFLAAMPFNHVVIDNFWTDEVAEQLYLEFPKYDDNKIWNAHYNSAIENKKGCNFKEFFTRT